MDDDLSDLLGPSAPPTKRRRGRPPNTRAQSTELLADDPDLENLPDGRVPDPSEFHRPVRVTFLATIFQTEPRRLHRKLSKCPVVAWENHKGQRVPVYDFKQAVQYIVDPKVDIATWIKSQTPASRNYPPPCHGFRSLNPCVDGSDRFAAVEQGAIDRAGASASAAGEELPHIVQASFDGQEGET